MTGVKSTVVHSGTEGNVTKQDMLCGSQYLAKKTRKGRVLSRYYATLAGAKNWLLKP